MRLLDFVRDHVTPYLDDSNVTVRRAAAAAAAAVLHRTASVPPVASPTGHPLVCPLYQLLDFFSAFVLLMSG
jgi:hypothetical protein